MRYWMGGGCENYNKRPVLVVSDTAIKSIRLPAYNEFQVNLVNALSLKYAECSINLYSEKLTCQLESHNLSHLERAYCKEWLEFEIGEHNFWVSISILPDFVFLENENLRSLVNSKSKTIKALTYEILFSPLLQVIEALTGQQVSLKKIINKFPKIDNPGCIFTSLIACNDERLECQFVFGEYLGGQFFSLIDQLNNKQAYRYDHLSLLARLQLGSTNLSLNDIHGLEKGDVVFVDHLLSTNLSVFRALINPNLTIVLKVEDSNFMVDEIITDNNAGLEVENSNNVLSSGHSVENSGGDVMSNLQINITFELGNISVSLEELRLLQIGSIIPLNRPLGKSVNIYNNGHLLGVGELVDIEDKVGVRIVELSGN